MAAALAVAGTLPSSAAQSHGPRDAVCKGMERLVRDDKFPAALAATVDRDGHTRDCATGVADLKTKAKVPVDGQIRVGSNTKTFTATVVLQLVGEGKAGLDAPIEKYLPGLVRGEGIDGHNITVRQLLQHTSGLPDYTGLMGEEALFGKGRHTYYQPRTLLDLTLAHKAEFAPGTSWAYSNTNYLLAGLLIEKVTGRPVAEQITKRVIDRIGLRTTVKVPDAFDSGSGIRFGLGLTSTPLSCGGLMWGHRGDIPGYHTRTGATDDGRAVTIATTAGPAPTSKGLDNADALLSTALCGM
ncbi:serine hydrolase domain-containing protein [Streptomyces olivoreticuli]